MSDLAHGAHQEFWRPPVSQTVVSVNADSCRRCGTELLVGSAFCHICGANRHRGTTVRAGNWTKYLSFLPTADISTLTQSLALPLPALAAFFVGGVFLILALGTGLVNAEFEAIQLWRIQWLLAACAAFLAGIMLKSRPNEKP